MPGPGAVTPTNGFLISGVQSNAPPTVAIINPRDGDTFTAPANIFLFASVPAVKPAAPAATPAAAAQPTAAPKATAAPKPTAAPPAAAPTPAPKPAPTKTP